MARQDNLLSMVQQITGELNLNVPNYVIGNLAQDVVQILALLKRSAKELIREFQWQALEKQYVFYTQFLDTTGNSVINSPILLNVNVANAPATFFTNPSYYYVRGSSAPTQDVRCVSVVRNTDPLSPANTATVTISQNATLTATGASLLFAQQVYPLPADYDSMVNRTHWDSSKRWEMLGPESPQQFNWLREGYISTGPRIRWRLQNNQFNTWPYFGTNERISMEYRGNSIVESASGVPQATFLADTDLIIIDEMLLILKTKLRYFEIKGFDVESLTQEYQKIMAITKANDHGAAILSFSPRPSEVLIGYQNIPDAGFGS